MIIKKTLSLRSIYEFTGHHLWWLSGWMLLVSSMYYFTHWKLMTIPWLPLSLIGTAVAFYVGFKNNHSYERIWEATVIWASIVNKSRKFATMVLNYRSEEESGASGDEIRRQMIFRHIAYLYQLREQLLEPTQWEHVSIEKPWRTGYHNQQRRTGLNNNFKEELIEIANRHYLPEEEKISLQGCSNKAAKLLNIQSGMVQQLYRIKAVNMIQQIDIQAAVNSFYEEQGNVERIKRTPFPRKYATFSFVFVCIFVFLLPFGIVGEFSRLGDGGVWLSVPIGAIVGWVYVVMEMIGDYSENPFEGLHNDIPMLSICRTIEIDLLQLMREKNIPGPILPKEHVLF